MLISYLEEDEDAAETARLVESAGRQAVQMRGDLADPGHCRHVIDEAITKLGRLDLLGLRTPRLGSSSLPTARLCA